jgi:hypothetical protein
VISGARIDQMRIKRERESRGLGIPIFDIARPATLREVDILDFVAVISHKINQLPWYIPTIQSTLLRLYFIGPIVYVGAKLESVT